MGKQFTDERERLAAFSGMDESQMVEGTSQYHRFENVNDKLDGIFKGIEKRILDPVKEPNKETECAIVKDLDGVNHLLAQTIVVKELKKKWDELGEVDFPVRIIYMGKKGEGSAQYQSFRLLFEKETKPVDKKAAK